MLGNKKVNKKMMERIMYLRSTEINVEIKFSVKNIKANPYVGINKG